MSNLKKYIGLSVIMVASFTGSAFGQSAGSRDADATTTINSPNTPAVEPRQSSDWGIRINATNNRDEPARKPFQMRAAVNVPIGGSVASGFLPIPAGKRLVIENVSAVGRWDVIPPDAPPRIGASHCFAGWPAEGTQGLRGFLPVVEGGRC